jgi:hypothetical protein
MATDRKKPGVAFWITSILIAVLAYPLSFGPACWLCQRGYISVDFVSIMHCPVIWAAWHGPRPFRLLIYEFEANCQGRSGTFAETYFENQQVMERAFSMLPPYWEGNFSIPNEVRFGNRNEEPGRKSPIASAAPMQFGE